MLPQQLKIIHLLYTMNKTNKHYYRIQKKEQVFTHIPVIRSYLICLFHRKLFSIKQHLPIKMLMNQRIYNKLID